MNRFGYYFRRATEKVVRLTRVNTLIYRFARGTPLLFSREQVDAARAFLEECSPNPKTSCICQNKIDPQVDLHIIVPAYNVERYIKECLDSVVFCATEKYTYLITVINDGSTDKTVEFLREYEAIPQIEIITQENKGFSGARNTGLSHIKGRYVLFLDSDDRLDWRGVERLLEVADASGAEIVVGAHTTIDVNGNRISFHKKRAGEISKKELGGTPWAKVFKAELFSDLCFPENYWYEDSIFAQVLYPRISRAGSISENTYYYRVNPSGITARGQRKIKSIDSYWITEQLFENRKELGLNITQEYYEYILRMVYLTFHRIRFQAYEVKKSVFLLFVDFIEKNCTGWSTQDKRFKEIEKVVKTRNLEKCIAFAKWM